MLIQFRFKNFKSFRDDTILDLSAAKIKEHESRIVTVGKERLLPTAAIFGANASGKSNVIEAFRHMTKYVMESFSYGGDSTKEKSEQPAYTPFLFDSASKDSESSFEVYFVESNSHSTRFYNYGFTVNRSGIVEEWLNTKAKTGKEYHQIFYRNGDTFDLPGIPQKSRENLKIALEKEVLLVSLGAKLKIAKLKVIRDWFYTANFTNFGNPVEDAILTSTVPEGFAEDKIVQTQVVSYISSFDPSIIGFQVDKSDDGTRLKIDAIHRTIDGGTATIPLRQESDGTLKMFALYPALQDTLANGGILFVDELNARLHPLLVRNFLLSFLDPSRNPNHAQLVFTTHDSWQLSNDLLRRDEIWFTEKDTDGVSSLYSLADFSDEAGTKIRKDESYEKNYLLGKYGGIPRLTQIPFHPEG